MQQNPSEAYSHSISQKKHCLLRKPVSQYSVHNIPSMVLKLSQMNPFHILTLYSLMSLFNNILPSTYSAPKWTLPFRVPDKTYLCMSHLPMRVTYSANLIIFDLIT